MLSLTFSILPVARVTLAVILGTSPLFAFQSENFMHWCGKPLNPWDHAKAMTVATTMVLSCKEEVYRLNLRPAFIKIITKMCATCRLCYAFAEDYNQTLRSFQENLVGCLTKFGRAWEVAFPVEKKAYNFDAEKVGEAAHRCATRHFPKDVRYALQTLMYAKDIMSG
ncbi:uncharacterized protein LOC144144901 [Haemaphysalis longicornis]